MSAFVIQNKYRAFLGCDIIRLPSEASVDNDHEAALHDIMSAREPEGACSLLANGEIIE